MRFLCLIADSHSASDVERWQVIGVYCELTTEPVPPEEREALRNPESVH